MPLKQRVNGNETQTKTNGRQGVVWRFGRCGSVRRVSAGGLTCFLGCFLCGLVVHRDGGWWI